MLSRLQRDLVGATRIVNQEFIVKGDVALGRHEPQAPVSEAVEIGLRRQVRRDADLVRRDEIRLTRRSEH